MSNYIKPNEHCFFTGMTQSGKTTAAMEYLKNEETQIYVLDTKGKFNWKVNNTHELIVINDFDKFSKHNKTKRKVVYRPVWEQLNIDYYNAFFEFCMKRQKCIILVDEAMQVCPSANKIPEWYKGALTRGMELNVGVWSLSQRPSKIPSEIISEATHYFIFRLNKIEDRERISDYTGYDEFFKIPEKYHFWYFNSTLDSNPEIGHIEL